MARLLISIASVVSLLIALILLGNFSPATAQKDASFERQCKDDTMKKIDKLISELDLVPSSSKRRFPDSLAKLKEACKANVKILNLVSVLIKKCLTGFQQNLMRITLYSIRNTQKTLCKKRPTTEMKAFVAAGNCVNTGRPKFRPCIRTAATNIYAMKLMPDKLKIPLVCCEIYRAKDCLLEAAKDVKECTPENIDTLQTRFAHASGNTMSFACGEYTEESDRCNAVHPPKGAKPPPANKSIVSVLFELLDHLPGDDEKTNN